MGYHMPSYNNFGKFVRYECDGYWLFPFFLEFYFNFIKYVFNSNIVK